MTGRRHRVYDLNSEQLIGEMDDEMFRRYCRALRASRKGIDLGGLDGAEWGFPGRTILVPDAGGQRS